MERTVVKERLSERAIGTIHQFVKIWQRKSGSQGPKTVAGSKTEHTAPPVCAKISMTDNVTPLNRHARVEHNLKIRHLTED